MATTYLINHSYVTNTAPVYVDVFSNLYANQYSGTGKLAWSLTSSSTDLSIDSNALITFHPNTYFTGFVTVTSSNVLNHAERISFKMNIAQTPRIYNPGTLYVVGNDIRNFSYSFSNMMPSSTCGPLLWTLNELTDFALDQNGLLTFNMSNIIADQYLDISSTSQSQSNIPITVTSSNVVGTPGQQFNVPSVYISSTIHWTTATSPNQPQVYMNSSLAQIYLDFPSNDYLSTSFRIAATNIAQGSDSHDVTLNLDLADIRATIPGVRQIMSNYPSPAGSAYTIKGTDINLYKTPPPNIVPVITGATIVSLTWNNTAAFPADLNTLYVHWYPVNNTYTTSYNQPVVFYTKFKNTPLLITDTFVVGQQYIFKITCPATATTLTETATVYYTPTYVAPLGYSVSLSGATTITHSWTSKLTTTLTISWTPRTASPYVTIPVNGPSNITIPSYLPNTIYTFTYSFAPEITGVYDSSNIIVSNYSINSAFLKPTITLNAPVTSSNSASMNLSWTPIIPSTGAPMFLQINPTDPASLVPSVTYNVPYYTSNITVTGLYLGTPYDINYTALPDPTGVYGTFAYGPVYRNVIVKNNPIINTSNFTASGATSVTLNWSGGIVPTAPGYVTWGTHTSNFSQAMSSITLPYNTVGLSSNFILNFAETSQHYSVSRTITYTPTYIAPPAVTINQPQMLANASNIYSGTHMNLSWNNLLTASGQVSYYYTNIKNNQQITSTPVIVPFTANQTSLALSNMIPGSNYTFNYYFNPDTSGVYGPTSNLNNTYTPKGQLYVDNIRASGGTTITLAWDSYILDDNQRRKALTNVPVTATWTPVTASLKGGYTPSPSSNVIAIPGFEANAATGYWFTLNFAAGNASLPYKTVYPALNALPFQPVLLNPIPPVIYVDSTKSTYTTGITANIVLVWNYNYVAAVNILSLNTVTGLNVNIRIDPNTANTYSLNDVSNGLPYIFTLSFQPDVSGVYLGYDAKFKYTVPSYPTINYIRISTIDQGVVEVQWDATYTLYVPGNRQQQAYPLQTMMSIVATPPPPANVVTATDIDSTLGAYVLVGFLPSITYKIDTTFYAMYDGDTQLTWTIVDEQEFIM
jgi:hypothetical protein